jgi:pimeloyl-ACP methyl ester carboxylesterase
LTKVNQSITGLENILFSPPAAYAMGFKGEQMTLPYVPPRRRKDDPRVSRRAVLRLGILGVASIGVETLLSGCSGQTTATVLSPATNVPAPTNPPPTDTPLPTDTPPPTNTPVPPTATAVPTSTPDLIHIAGPLDGSSIITLADGRKLGIIDTGQPDGIPILMNNGTPSSRVLYNGSIDYAKKKGVRLISYDRPGYGDSTPLPGRTVGSAAEDVAAIAKSLDLEKLLVMGLSGGGSHVLSCAALLPDLVVAAVDLAGFAPIDAKGLDWYAGQTVDNKKELNTALKGLGSFKAAYYALVDYWKICRPADFYEAVKASFPASVADITYDISNYSLSQVREGMKNGFDGWYEDDIATITPWGFDPGQIKIPVLLIYHEKDEGIPMAHGKWLASKIPNVQTNFTGKGGHLSMISRIPEAMDWLLNQWK